MKKFELKKNSKRMSWKLVDTKRMNGQYFKKKLYGSAIKFSIKVMI